MAYVLKSGGFATRTPYARAIQFERMLLALFLIDLAAGLYLFLPLVGRRNAGVKFYRLILITTGALDLGAQLAHVQRFRPLEAAAVVLTLVGFLTPPYPKRPPFRHSAALLS